MHRSILYIAVILVLWVSAQAQVIAPMGLGLPAAPDKIAEYKKGIITVYDDRDRNIALSYWNGFFWETYPSPTTLKTDENFKIIDLKTQEDNIYLAIGKSADYHIYKWSDNTWSETTNDVTRNALSIDALFLENNKIKCLGIFTNNGSSANILSQNAANEWELEGNLITSKFNENSFKTVAQTDGKLVATGRFVDPKSSNITLAEWNGSEWKPASLPPFLGQNITAGIFNENIIVYGESAHEPAGFKLEIDKTWTNINEGLDLYEIESVKQFAQLNDQLIAIGTFTNKNSNTEENILIYDGDKWTESLLTVDNIEQAFSYKNTVLISGDFDDNGSLKGIGTIYNDRALVQARVYNDINRNCIKDANEEWLPNYPLKINKDTYLSTNQTGIVYIETGKTTLDINAAPYKYARPTCPSTAVDVSEYKTYYGTVLGVYYEPGNSDVSLRLEDKSSNLSIAGEIRNANVCIQNEGTQPVFDAKLTLNLANVTNFNSALQPESIINDIATWTINLSRGDENCFSVSYILKDADQGVVKADITLPSVVEDKNVLNNTSQIKYKTGTTEFNHKYCENGKLLGKNSDQLSYKINFRNPRLHNVKSVIIVDELDEDLSLSFKGIEATTSHRDNVELSAEQRTDIHGITRNVLIIKYNNINLPTADVDSVAASGFLDLLINVNEQTMVEGLEICNKALIYFEMPSGVFYEPVGTNEVCSVVGETLSVTSNTPDIEKIKLLITPNPAKNYITIENSELRNLSLVLINAIGQEVLSTTIPAQTDEVVDISQVASGVYTLYADGLFAQKVVVTK